MTEPPGDSRRAAFRALIDAAWAQAEGSLIEPRRKKSPRLWVSLGLPKCRPDWLHPFPPDALRTPCSRLMPCDLDDACRALKPALAKNFPRCFAAPRPAKFFAGPVLHFVSPASGSGPPSAARAVRRRRGQGVLSDTRKRKEPHHGQRTRICQRNQYRL